MKKKKAQKRMRTDGSDLEKLYTRDIDDFLNDSDWDVESIAPSNVSHQSARSHVGDGRLRGLESIYLQRLESTLGKKGVVGGLKN
jgi:hypothetical protein